MNPLESLLIDYISAVKSLPIKNESPSHISITGEHHNSRDGIYATIKMAIHHRGKIILVHSWQLTVVSSGILRCEMTQSLGKIHTVVVEEARALDALQNSKIIDNSSLAALTYTITNIFNELGGAPQAYFKDFM